MIVFPNCKINLGLNIIRKREDGYHDLETVFYPLNFFDALEIVNAAKEKTDDCNLTVSGIHVDAPAPENICIRAYRLLKKDFPQLPAVDIYLHKAIPVAAGLGGGSADGAFTLKLLNEKYQLGISARLLSDYALQLGSDCPFFITNKPCFATGRGEKMEEITLNLSAYKMIVVNPGIPVNTAAAFSRISPARPEKSIKKIISEPVEQWKDQLINDFEKVVFEQHPLISEIKQTLYDAGASYASMTGSGSTVFGLFKNEIPGGLRFADSFLQIRI